MYHYKESGLDNIWLVNGYTAHQTPYGEGISIHNTVGLNRAIGQWLVSLPKPLNGAEFRFLRFEMELTQKHLGALLGADEQAVRRWEKYRTKPIHGAADRLLRAIYSEYTDGDGSVRAMVDRLTSLREIEPLSVCFKQNINGWKPESDDVHFTLSAH
jgi:putative transcriptional regulator